MVACAKAAKNKEYILIHYFFYVICNITDNILKYMFLQSKTFST